MRRTSHLLGPVLTALLLASVSPDLAGQRGSDKRRDEWQRPEEVLDALSAQPGSRVADVGAGRGYFTFKMADRVGTAGRVYAVDIRDSNLEDIRQRKVREKLDQIEVILGKTDDPRLPDGLDGILVFNAYHEFREYDAMMAAMFRALRSGGRLVIIDRAGDEGRDRDAYFGVHRVPGAVVQAEAEQHGLVLVERRAPLDDPENSRDMFFLVFERRDSRPLFTAVPSGASAPPPAPSSP